MGHQPLAGGIPERIGPYRIEAELGRGAMGAVFRARHAELDRVVALKVLLSTEGTLTRRFQLEAQAAAALGDHPGIVAVRDTGADDGRYWLAMDFVDGRTLEELLRDEGPLPERRLCRIGAQVARALAHAHAAGVLHRDLKPANILIEGEQARVADFGLARMEQAGAEITRLTNSGTLLGTPAYMPPEQARGETAVPASDCYALGATLYESASGAPPFTAATVPGLIRALLQDDPVPLRRAGGEVSRGFEAVVARCLAKRAEDRYAGAAELAEDLERCAVGEPPAVLRTVAPATRRARRRGALAGAVTLAAAAAAGAVGISLWQAEADSTHSETLARRYQEEQRTRAPLENAAAVYQALLGETIDDLELLEDTWRSAVPAPEPVRQARARLRNVTSRLSTEHPESELPRAWMAMAMVLSGEAEAALPVRRESGDPFVHIVAARLALTHFTRSISLPAAEIQHGRMVVGPWKEPERAAEFRAAAIRAVERAEAVPGWGRLPQGAELRAFATGLRQFGAGDLEAALDALADLSTHRWLGPNVGLLRGLLLYRLNRLEEAAHAFTVAAKREWMTGLQYRATTVFALATRDVHAGADPVARCEAVIADCALLLERMPDHTATHGTAGMAHGTIARWHRRHGRAAPEHVQRGMYHARAQHAANRSAATANNLGAMLLVRAGEVQAQGETGITELDEAVAVLTAFEAPSTEMNLGMALLQRDEAAHRSGRPRDPERLERGWRVLGRALDRRPKLHAARTVRYRTALLLADVAKARQDPAGYFTWLERSLEDGRHLVAAQPVNVRRLLEMGDTTVQLARRARQAGQAADAYWRDALSLGERAVVAAPKRAQAYILRGIARVESGHGEAGLADLDTALDLPDCPGGFLPYRNGVARKLGKPIR